MNRATLRWIRGRTPVPPDAFMPWLEEEGPDGKGGGEADPEAPGREAEATVRELAGAGMRSLDGARRGAWPEREAAFRLLAADAYITWACEATLECAEPGRELERVLGIVAEGHS